MEYLMALLTDPAAWIALATLVVMEVVLGIDNLIFISILSNKLPEEKRHRARQLGIGAALVGCKGDAWRRGICCGGMRRAGVVIGRGVRGRGRVRVVGHSSIVAGSATRDVGQNALHAWRARRRSWFSRSRELRA